MSQCTNCFLDLTLNPPLAGGLCPNCGRPVAGGDAHVPPSLAPVGPGAPMALLERFWSSLRDLILRPASFFRREAGGIVSEEGLSTALAFAVIVQWLASFFNFIWRSTVGVMLQNRMDDLFRIAGDVLQTPNGAETLDELRARAVEFLFGAGAIVLTPFTTIIKLSLIAILVHAAVRFFMKEESDRPHSYAATLKILSYASAPWILCVIPGVGMVAAWILAFAAAVIGLREVYRTTSSRAIVAVLFPELLFLAFMAAVGVFFLFMAFNVLRLVF